MPFSIAAIVGHEKEENDCKEERMDYEMIGNLQDEVCGHYMFQHFKAAIDKRPKEIECKQCNKTFKNRLQREQHDKSSHGGERTKFGLDKILIDLRQRLKLGIRITLILQ